MSDTEVLASNTAACLEMSNKISEMARDTSSPESISISGEDRFTVIVSQARLIDWFERLVAQDLYQRGLAKEHTDLKRNLSNRAQNLFDRSRDDAVMNHVRADILESVYSSIDRRELWHEFDKQGFSDREIQWAAYFAGSNVQCIVNGENDADFAEFARARAAPSRFPKIAPYAIPEFRHMPELERTRAQKMYDNGHTIEEALFFAQKDTLQNAVQHLIPQDLIPSGIDMKDVKEMHSVEEFQEPHRARMVIEIMDGFPSYGLMQFANIYLGLTPVIAADVDSIQGVLKQAFDQKLPLSRPLLDKRMQVREDKSIWTVALSYKHLSRDVRMGHATQRKVARALSELAKSEGFDRMTIWLDTILSENKNSLSHNQKGSWAVNGIYPYLTNDVVRVVGNDDEYNDRDESSMWMKVEEMCADKKSCYTVTLDMSSRGFAYYRDSTGSYERAKVRMMNLARFIVNGGLVDKLVSWVPDKKQLILWAEASMIANQPLLMDQKKLEALSTLRIDNLVSFHNSDKSNDMSAIRSYIANAGTTVHRAGLPLGGWILSPNKSRRGMISGWLGLFEIFPGLLEASHRNFVPLFPYVYPGSVRIGRISRLGNAVIFGKIQDAISFELELCKEMKKVLSFESRPYDVNDESSEFEYKDFDIRDLDESSWR